MGSDVEIFAETSADLSKWIEIKAAIDKITQHAVA